MDIKRLEYIMPLDVDMVSSSLMELYIEKYAFSSPEELANWTADKMGKSSWMESEHFMRDWMIAQAKRIMESYDEEEV